MILNFQNLNLTTISFINFFRAMPIMKSITIVGLVVGTIFCIIYRLWKKKARCIKKSIEAVETNDVGQLV